jgi:hypothetical protein
MSTRNEQSKESNRPTVLGVLTGMLFGASLATLGLCLGDADRVSVLVLLVISGVLLLADVLVFAFYDRPPPPWRWVTVSAAVGAVTVIDLALIGWLVSAIIVVEDEDWPQPGTYSGTTSQGRPLDFDVVDDGRAIARIKFSVEGTCPVSIQGLECKCEVNRVNAMDNPWPIAETSGTVLAKHGFSYCPGEFEFAATFDSETTASGLLRIHTYGTPGGEEPCESSQVTWSATLQ